jgi:hypothetical protein
MSRVTTSFSQRAAEVCSRTPDQGKLRRKRPASGERQQGSRSQRSADGGMWWGRFLALCKRSAGVNGTALIKIWSARRCCLRRANTGLLLSSQRLIDKMYGDCRVQREGRMSEARNLAVIVGSLRKESLNRKVEHALAGSAPDR